MLVVVINLERSKDRLRRVADRFQRVGLRFEVAKALDGSQEEHVSLSRYDEARRLRRCGSSLVAAEIASFASHFRLWERCAAGCQPYLICEDDIVVECCLAELISILEVELQTWPLIRLGGTISRREYALKDLGMGLRLVRFVEGPRGAFAYALSPEGARALVANAGGWLRTVDDYLDRFWEHGVASVGVRPYPATHESRDMNVSTVDTRARRRIRSVDVIVRRESYRLYDDARRAIYNLRRFWGSERTTAEAVTRFAERSIQSANE